MKVIKLSVPFHQKDQAKALGAKWNPQEKYWFITEKEDASLFTEWLPNKNHTINLRVDHYYIAQSFRDCWKCGYKSQVYAIILPKTPPHSREYAKILYYLQHLGESTQKRFEALTPHYFYDYSNTISSSYWMNHCQQCKVRFGDFETIEEFTSPFRPMSVDEAKNITLNYIKEPLEAFGEISKSVAFLECMKVILDPIPPVKL